MKIARYPLKRLSVSVLGPIFMATAARALDVGQYVISAKAGGVNLASGSVTVRHRGQVEWQPITAKGHLNAGDLVRTGDTGRLEILLNPGSYLRLSANSEFELTDPTLNSLRMRLFQGSSIIEASGFGGTELQTKIDTPQTRITLVQNGLYRVDVGSNRTELRVRKGRALVGRDIPTKVKRGKKIVVSDQANLQIAKLDKSSHDSLDTWSLERAETLIAANRRLSNPNLAYSIARAMSRGWGLYPWSYGGLGLWIYDPLLACDIFYPFYHGVSSPYGSGYSNGYGLPSDYYRPPAPGGGPGSNPARERRSPGPGGDLSVRPVPMDRQEVRALREHAIRDVYGGREMGGFDRVPSSSPGQSGPSYGRGPVYAPAPAVSAPSAPRGGAERSGRGGVAR